jgi:hypothetical protein
MTTVFIKAHQGADTDPVETSSPFHIDFFLQEILQN